MNAAPAPYPVAILRGTRDLGHCLGLQLARAAAAFDSFARRVAQTLDLPSAGRLRTRCHALRPVHQLKWRGLLLDEFLGSQQARRRFSLGTAEAEQRKQTQLERASDALAALSLPLPF